MNYSQQIKAIKETLHQQGWTKGSYFQIVDNQICCCVHGAAQIVCNPEVRRILSTEQALSVAMAPRERLEAVTEVAGAVTAAAAWAATAADAGARAAAAWAADVSKKRAWETRPSWVRRRDLDLHWLIGMFEITTSFNDGHNTALKDVLDRLDQCAAWAEQNEDFLANN